MKRKLPYLGTVAAAAIAYLSLTGYSSGNPGNSTSGCSCHGPNSAQTIIALSGVPSGGYVAGTTYPLTVTVSNSAFTLATNKGGFDLKVSAGTLAAGTGTRTVNSNKEIVQSSSKAMSSGSVSWTFNWTAPTTGSSVTVNVAGNATNGDGSDNNGNGTDKPNINTFTYQAASTATAPVISNSSISQVTANNATVSATIDAGGAATTVTVEYGQNGTFGSSVATTPGTVSNGSQSVTASLSGLSPHTVYSFRFRAVNSAGTTVGPSQPFQTGNSTSVTSLEQGAQVQLYPNPAASALQLLFAEEQYEVSVSAVDLNGKMLPLRAAVSGKLAFVDVSMLAPGHYFLNVQAGKNASRLAFVKR